MQKEEESDRVFKEILPKCWDFRKKCRFVLMYYVRDFKVLVKEHLIYQFFALQEGANINKSLTTLGKVISALAEVVSIIKHYYGVYKSGMDFLSVCLSPSCLIAVL